MHSVNQLLFHLLLGHALGFYHEQSRPDRDNYVTIYKQNIMQGRELSYDAYLKIELTQASFPTRNYPLLISLNFLFSSFILAYLTNVIFHIHKQF